MWIATVRYRYWLSGVLGTRFERELVELTSWSLHSIPTAASGEYGESTFKETDIFFFAYSFTS